jgi:hypothetical protein
MSGAASKPGYMTMLLLAGLAASGAGAAAAPPQPAPVAKTLASTTGVPRSQRAEWYWAGRYGVDHLQVHSIASGSSLEFRYRVLNAQKAKNLADKRANPYLIDWKSGAKLMVPQTEQIGQLRQVSTQEPGREYFMIFNNPGKLVKPGNRVDVVAGGSRLEGLIVE